MDIRLRGLEMKAFFGRKTEGYDDVHIAFMGSKTALTDALKEMYTPGTPIKVLDLGAGTGLELIPLFEAYPEASVTAADISEDMLSALMHRPFADRVTCVIGDFFETDPGCDYDAVISTSALHHFPPEDKATLYRKVFAAMKPGAVFANADKCADNDEEQRLCLDEYAENPLKYSHMDTPLTVECECDVLRKAGFDVKEVRPLPNAKYNLFTAVKPE